MQRVDKTFVETFHFQYRLRPLRYSITSDNLLFAGSETGMIKMSEEIVSKGRLGPGQLNMYTIQTKNYLKIKKLKISYQDYKKNLIIR